MEIFLIILSIILAIFGLLGSIIPILPGGILLNYISLLILFLIKKSEFGINFLIIFGIITIISIILDNVIPLMTAKSKGASKLGMFGAGVGTFLGMFIFPPLGIIIFTIIGGVIGELISNKGLKTGLQTGIWSFIGFLLSTFLKIVISGIMTFYFFYNLIK